MASAPTSLRREAVRTGGLVSYEHVHRMSDDTGLMEHARGAIPRREHGYCVDDVARGLLVLCREPAPAVPENGLIARLLAFLAHAQDASGRFHNRLSYDRRWLDEASTGDWWGRALWGLGTAAARGNASWLRTEALTCFNLGVGHRSTSSRAMAFAAMGAAEVLDRYPDHPRARRLLRDATAAVGRPDFGAAWPWPEPRLCYANAVLAETLLVDGGHNRDDALVADGLRLLEWLLAQETRDGHLSLTPTRGWRHPEPRPAFDQQAIEAAALVDACARAFSLTGDGLWATGIGRGVDWFLGDNDAGVPMMDAGTGGGFDGLSADAANINQGAESTLALLSTLQHGFRLEVR
jgi:hypothetical protein